MPSSATTAFVNAALFDGHRYLGDAGPLVVSEGRIVAVGGEVPAGAEVVDCGGGLLAPGFVDAHVHAVQGGLERTRCDLSEVHTREDYLATIRAYADAHPDLPWILGGGWAMSAFPGGTPTAADLDTVVPDRPVFLPNRDHHGAWVNTRALEVAGITRDTPDPAHGRFERDADGHPTGTLHEGAMHAVVRHVPATSEADYYRGLLEGQAYLHSLGVTGWQDAIVGQYAGMDDPGPTYLRAAQRGDLTAHVVGALWWDREQGEEQIASLVERRTAYTHGRFRATSIKFMQDGVAENGTAALGAPYLDRCGHATTNSGHSFLDPQALRTYVGRLDAEGFQVHVHGIGDRGVREALDAFEGLDPTTDRRHHVAHLQFVHPDDVRRFGALGVAANMQALWACLDEQMLELDSAVRGRGASDLAVPLRRAAPHRGPAGGRQRLAGEHAEPARGDPRGGQPVGPRRDGTRRQRAVPARAGAGPRDRVRGVHEWLGVDQPPRRGRNARPRAGGRPGGARPRPLRR